jgi:hypothetical protein
LDIGAIAAAAAAEEEEEEEEKILNTVGKISPKNAAFLRAKQWCI